MHSHRYLTGKHSYTCFKFPSWRALAEYSYILFEFLCTQWKGVFSPDQGLSVQLLPEAAISLERLHETAINNQTVTITCNGIQILKSWLETAYVHMEAERLLNPVCHICDNEYGDKNFQLLHYSSTNSRCSISANLFMMTSPAVWVHKRLQVGAHHCFSRKLTTRRKRKMYILWCAINCRGKRIISI